MDPKSCSSKPIWLYQCKCSKNEIVVLKLDFEKAFDTIEHTKILQVLHHMVLMRDSQIG
jgi:hypothetical protein